MELCESNPTVGVPLFVLLPLGSMAAVNAAKKVTGKIHKRGTVFTGLPKKDPYCPNQPITKTTYDFIAAHEFSHSCGASEGGANAVATLALKELNTMYPDQAYDLQFYFERLYSTTFTIYHRMKQLKMDAGVELKKFLEEIRMPGCIKERFRDRVSESAFMKLYETHSYFKYKKLEAKKGYIIGNRRELIEATKTKADSRRIELSEALEKIREVRGPNYKLKNFLSSLSK